MADVMTTMRETIGKADKAGLQVRIHAIGDRANAAIFDHFEAVEKTNGPSGRRFTIEHAQHLHPDDIPRFARLDVIPAMQAITTEPRWTGS